MIKQKNKILFNVDENISKLSPHMFGANLEHIGEAIYKNGVWAEDDAREPWFLCEAHTDEIIDETLNKFEDAVKVVRG